MSRFSPSFLFCWNRPRGLGVPGAVRSFGTAFALAAWLSASGCTALPPAVLDYVPESLRGALGLPSAVPSPQPSASPSEVPLDAATRGRMNSEVLQEIYRVALMHEPENRSQFGTLVDTLNQGASLAGIYNGLIHSTAWVALEASGQSALPAAIRAFAEEMAHLEFSLPPERRRAFTANDARPLSVTIDYGALERAAADPNAVGDPSAAASPALPPVDEKWEDAVKRIEMVFVGANLFTLKRLLGEEVIRVVDEKKSDRTNLVVWFGQFAARTSAKGVDFGLEKRNETSVDFHRNWAWSVSIDRLEWELLNREHRILNAASLQ